MTATEAFDIAEVLGSAGRTLVPDEGVAANEIHGKVAERAALACGPGIFEADARQLGQDVNAAGRNAHLKDHAWASEVVLNHLMEWCV